MNRTENKSVHGNATFTVEYRLTEEQQERLKKLTEKYSEYVQETSPDKVFSFIMGLGSRFDIDDKLKFHEDYLEAQNVGSMSDDSSN